MACTVQRALDTAMNGTHAGTPVETAIPPDIESVSFSNLQRHSTNCCSCQRFQGPGAAVPEQWPVNCPTGGAGMIVSPHPPAQK